MMLFKRCAPLKPQFFKATLICRLDVQRERTSNERASKIFQPSVVLIKSYSRSSSHSLRFMGNCLVLGHSNWFKRATSLAGLYNHSWNRESALLACGSPAWNRDIYAHSNKLYTAPRRYRHMGDDEKLWSALNR